MSDDTGESEVDDDAEYYRQEVGQEPDSGVFISKEVISMFVGSGTCCTLNFVSFCCE